MDCNDSERGRWKCFSTTYLTRNAYWKLFFLRKRYCIWVLLLLLLVLSLDSLSIYVKWKWNCLINVQNRVNSISDWIWFCCCYSFVAKSHHRWWSFLFTAKNVIQPEFNLLEANNTRVTWGNMKLHIFWFPTDQPTNVTLTRDLKTKGKTINNHRKN